MPVKPNNQRADRGKNRKAGNAPGLSAEEKRKALAKELRLRPKTIAFVDELTNNPKISAAEAYIRTHETENRITASNAASKLLKSPAVQGYKDSAVGKAKRRVVQLVDSDNESIALKASESIIDRMEGKAVQRSENINRTVEVKLDLTGVRAGAHHLQSVERPLLP